METKYLAIKDIIQFVPCSGELTLGRYASSPSSRGEVARAGIGSTTGPSFWVPRRLTDPVGKTVVLTSGEFNLLAAFLATPNMIVTRSQLLEATRVSDDIYERSIDVQVVRLRRKLRDDPRVPHMIETQRGVGYIFTASVSKVL